MNPMTKTNHYLKENLYSNLDVLNHAHLTHLCPIFRKKKKTRETRLTWQNKFFLLPNIFFSNKNEVNLKGFLTLFHVKQSEFGNIKRFLSYIQICMKNCKKKTGFTGIAIHSKSIKIFGS